MDTMVINGLVFVVVRSNEKTKMMNISMKWYPKNLGRLFLLKKSKFIFILYLMKYIFVEMVICNGIVGAIKIIYSVWSIS